MIFLKRIIALVLVMLFALSGVGAVYAEDPPADSADKYSSPVPSLLPAIDSADTGVKTVSDCQKIMNGMNAMSLDDFKLVKEQMGKREKIEPVIGDPEVSYKTILACGIKTGNIKLWMVPYYVRYALEFIIGLAGLIAVGAMIIGGYLYLFAGLSQDKEKGKNAIKNGIIGLVLTLCAWAVVNIVMSLVTG